MNITHLQGIGKVTSKPAVEFKVGESMMWNHGYTSEVVAVTRETKAFITFAIKCEDGKVYERKLKKDRLVAIAKPTLARSSLDQLI